MQRQILFSLFAVMMLATPAHAQRSFEIPGIGSIFFGGDRQRDRVDPSRLDTRFKVLDRQRNYNEERRVVFDVGRRQGRFSQLRIRAIGKVVRITGMEVVFGNGKSQHIDIYQAIYPGEVSPALDLTGDARNIRRVVLTKRPTWQRDRGDIELLGLPDETGDYRLIGKKRLGDRDREVMFSSIKNGRGGFDSIRLRALGEAVRVTTIEITFSNRRTQIVRYYKRLQPGYLSDPIKLDGKSRNIRSVVVNKRRSWSDGRGGLQLFGLPGKAPPKPVYSVLGTERVIRPNLIFAFNNFNQRHSWNYIRLKALDRAVRIKYVIIVFRDGSRQRVDLGRLVLDPGKQSRVIKLNGRSARRIDRIRVGVARRPRPRGRLQVLASGPRRVATKPRRDRRQTTQTRVPKGWVLFGSDAVGRRSERQVIKIGREAGVFDRITFRVLRNDVYIRDVTIVYGNGNRDRQNIDLLVPANYGTPPIDLKTRRGSSGRYIREIIVNYRAEGRSWGNTTALVQVFGEYAEDWLRRDRRSARGADRWIRLGARRAAMFSKDSDAISVGRRFGRFRSVKVRVLRNKVKLYGMTITYENGTTETVPVYGTIRSGTETKPIDLEGRRRFIKRIDLRYRTKFNFGGDAIVEVWGQR